MANDPLRDLTPFLDRVCTTHYWVAKPDGMRHRQRPLPADTVAKHLDVSYPLRVGACPIAPGTDTVCLALFDVDDVETDPDCARVFALCERSEEYGLIPNPVWSSSGKGVHIYFLWPVDRPQKAHDVRYLMHEVLKAEGLRPGVGGLQHREVEVFPKQDAVAADRWGSMFILPFGTEKSRWASFPRAVLLHRAEGARLRLSPDVPAAPVSDVVRNEASNSSYPIEYVEEVLKNVPNGANGAASLKYDEWFEVIAGIHHATAGSEAGYAAACEWSAQSTKHDDAFLERRVWPYLDATRPNPITFKSVELRARQEGWRPGLMFEALPEEPVADESTAPASTSKRKEAVLVPYSAFTAALEAPHYVWDEVLQQGCLYALTARWGHGKTAIALSVAMHVAAGVGFHGRQVAPGKVLYLCGENPADVRLRAVAVAQVFGLDSAALEGVYFTQRPFAMDNGPELERFLRAAVPVGPFALAVIDTGPAHSAGQEENDNREMHALAIAMRDFMAPLGNPATVALMHPAKGAGRESLEPRGGGAFSGSIDGELCAWSEGGVVEFFHRTKFRGPGFEPLYFALTRTALPGMLTNFGRPVVTVVATPTEAPKEPAKPRGKWQTLVCEGLAALGGVAGLVAVEDLIFWCLENTEAPESGRDERNKYAKRALEQLIQTGGIKSTEGGLSFS